MMIFCMLRISPHYSGVVGRISQASPNSHGSSPPSFTSNPLALSSSWLPMQRIALVILVPPLATLLSSIQSRSSSPCWCHVYMAVLRTSQPSPSHYLLKLRSTLSEAYRHARITMGLQKEIHDVKVHGPPFTLPSSPKDTQSVTENFPTHPVSQSHSSQHMLFGKTLELLEEDEDSDFDPSPDQATNQKDPDQIRPSCSQVRLSHSCFHHLTTLREIDVLQTGSHL